MDVAWTDLVDGLPEEAGPTSLGPDSKAAKRFADGLARLWLTPETWMKEGGAVGGQRGVSSELVRRMSLASRARELAKGNRKEGWQRVHDAVNVFFALEIKAGRQQVLLAMREDACRYAIKGQVLPGVTGPDAFRTLVDRYGLLANQGAVPPALVEGAADWGIVVLDPAFAAVVLAEAEEGDPEEHIDPETGEVARG